MLVGGEPGPWGHVVDGGRRRRLLKRITAVVAVGGLVAGAAIGTTGLLLVQQTEANLTRVAVPELEQAPVATDARNFLLVGSDARDGIADDDRSELSLGDFEGQRSDTIIYVSISEDRNAVSLVSLPRDLLVRDGDQRRKLTDTFAGGPDQLVRVVRENFGLPVNHYAQVSLGGFIEVVRTLGGVQMCPDEPLVDPKSGADFAAGCQQFGPTEALAYVRSRKGSRADFERIDRQQEFLTSVLGELTATRTLANAPQLFRLVEDLATNVTTDESLGLNQMLGLANEMRQVVDGGVPMTTVPAYPRTIDGLAFMVPYGPGATAMFDDLRAGRPLAERGSREQRDETVVALWSGGRDAGIVRSTLQWAGFRPGLAGSGPTEADAGSTTTVYIVPGEERAAGWVAATLGAPMRPLPAGATPPADATVVVGVGDDGTG